MAVGLVEPEVFFNKQELETSNRVLNLMLAAREFGIGEMVMTALDKAYIVPMSLGTQKSTTYEFCPTDFQDETVAGLLYIPDNAKAAKRLGSFIPNKTSDQFFYVDELIPGLVQLDTVNPRSKKQRGFARFLIHMTSEYGERIPAEIYGSRMTAMDADNRLTVPKIKQLLKTNESIA